MANGKWFRIYGWLTMYLLHKLTDLPLAAQHFFELTMQPEKLGFMFCALLFMSCIYILVFLYLWIFLQTNVLAQGWIRYTVWIWGKASRAPIGWMNRNASVAENIGWGLEWYEEGVLPQLWGRVWAYGLEASKPPPLFLQISYIVKMCLWIFSIILFFRHMEMGVLCSVFTPSICLDFFS